MNKEEIKSKMEEVEESYKQIAEQITQLKQNKYRLEGQFGLLQDMLKEDEEDKQEELEEMSD